MEKMIRKLAKAMDTVAGQVGKLEKKVIDQFDKNAPKNLKNFMKEPRIVFDNSDRLIPKSKIMAFLDKQAEGVPFGKMLETIVKLKIDNIFESSKKTKKKATKATKKTVKKTKAKPKKKSTSRKI